MDSLAECMKNFTQNMEPVRDHTNPFYLKAAKSNLMESPTKTLIEVHQEVSVRVAM